MTTFELAPAAGTIVGDNGFKKVQKSALVNGLALANLNRPRCQVALPLVNNALGIGHDGVVDKYVDMIFGPEQRTNIATERKVWPVGAFDGLGHVRVGGMY